MKYKVGDKIVLATEFDMNKVVEVVGWASEMGAYLGKVATIVGFDECSEDSYSIDIDNEGWSWCDHLIDHDKTLALQKGEYVEPRSRNEWISLSEIEWVDGNVYIDKSGEHWTVKGKEVVDSIGTPITEVYLLNTILKLEVIRGVSWVDTPADTKVFVSDNGIEWENAYFSHFENGRIYTYANGRSSYTSNGLYTDWQYAELYN